MLNKVIIVANLTKDPESRQTNNGTSVCKLGLAINRKWKDKEGNPVEEATFVDCDVWGKTADFCRDYLRKGFKVFIEGRLKMDTWQDQKTGQNRSRLGLVAESVQNMTPKQQQPPLFPEARQ